MELKIRKIPRVRIGPIGEAVLTSIAAVGVVSFLAVFPGITVLIAPFLKKKKYSPKQAIQRNVDSLVRSGLLERHINSRGDVQLKITQKGRREVFFRSIKHDTQENKWDSTWRVVIFDVPEAKFKIRNELRKAMVMYGFKKLQQSVWVYPYPCDEFISLIKEYLGVSNDVLYMKVGYIENDKHLRKEFSL